MSAGLPSHSKVCEPLTRVPTPGLKVKPGRAGAAQRRRAPWSFGSLLRHPSVGPLKRQLACPLPRPPQSPVSVCLLTSPGSCSCAPKHTRSATNSQPSFPSSNTRGHRHIHRSRDRESTFHHYFIFPLRLILSRSPVLFVPLPQPSAAHHEGSSRRRSCAAGRIRPSRRPQAEAEEGPLGRAAGELLPENPTRAP